MYQEKLMQVLILKYVNEIRNGLNNKGFLIAAGYGENILVLAEYFISLGAKVRIEQK